jgi:protein-S-isoprenylcysteine O-methyltransferase Ste14
LSERTEAAKASTPAAKTAGSRWKKIARRIRVPLGFCFAAVFLWLARPSWQSMAWSLLLVVPGVWLRGYAAGYVKKNAELTMTGPYAYTRNPLYLGSMMIAFGFAAAAGSWWILLVLAALFLAIYMPTILSEEEYLRGRFAGFDAYAAKVPRLLPRLTPARIDSPNTGASAGGSFSKPLYLHHREYNAAMGALAIYAALAARLWYLSR